VNENAAHVDRFQVMSIPPSPHGVNSKRTLAVTGVMVVIFLFAIDATIVSTSMPTIVA
jgi:hypothetical protein